MSRVFEMLTAAVDKKKDLAEPETEGTAAEADSIVRFYRALRSQSGLSGAYSGRESARNKEISHTTQLKADSGCHQFAVHQHTAESAIRRVFRLKPIQVALLTSSLLIIVYLGMPAYYTNRKQVDSTHTTDNREQNIALIETSDGAESLLDKRDFAFGAAADRPAILASLDSVAPPVQSGNLYKTWAVQVSAITSKKVADDLMQQLRAEGYPVYVVRAEVKGELYHRVRIGPFTECEEAEPVRESLSRQEAYRGAYVVAN